jgi:hypothetical protein
MTNSLVSLLGIAATLMAAGIWLGALQNRVSQLERNQVFYHGALQGGHE